MNRKRIRNQNSEAHQRENTGTIDSSRMVNTCYYCRKNPGSFPHSHLLFGNKKTSSMKSINLDAHKLNFFPLWKN